MTNLRTNLPVICSIILWLVACTTGARLLNDSSSGNLKDSGSSVYLLGPARALLSENLYERADTYYHKGATHKEDVAFVGFFKKWKNMISPVEVQHAKDSEILEIMPWLRLATAADPKNIEAYRVAAYWLCHECNKPELAIDVLTEAATKNPDRYEVQLEIGRMHLYLNKMEPAAAAFDRALSLLDQQPMGDPEQVVIDRGMLLTLRSYLYELNGDAAGALTMAKLNMTLNPDREALHNRVEQLQIEPLNPERARAQITTIFGQTHKTIACSHEEHVHGENCGCTSVQEAHVDDDACGCSHEAHATTHVHDEHCEHAVPRSEHVHGPDCNH